MQVPTWGCEKLNGYSLVGLQPPTLANAPLTLPPSTPYPLVQPSYLGSTGISFSAHHLGDDRNPRGKHQGVHFQRLEVIDGQKGVHPISWEERKWKRVDPRRSQPPPRPLPERRAPCVPGSSPSLRVSTSSGSICNSLESRSPPEEKRLSGLAAILGVGGSLREMICPAELPLSHPQGSPLPTGPLFLPTRLASHNSSLPDCGLITCKPPPTRLSHPSRPQSFIHNPWIPPPAL